MIVIKQLSSSDKRNKEKQENIYANVLVRRSDKKGPGYSDYSHVQKLTYDQIWKCPFNATTNHFIHGNFLDDYPRKIYKCGTRKDHKRIFCCPKCW
jgi:hypothetical protein